MKDEIEKKQKRPLRDITNLQQKQPRIIEQKRKQISPEKDLLCSFEVFKDSDSDHSDSLEEPVVVEEDVDFQEDS